MAFDFSRRALCASLLTISFGLAGCAPKDPQALLLEGEMLRQKGDHKAAIIQFKNALQANPELGNARLALGLTYLDSGDTLSAEKELRRAKAAGVGGVDVNIGLARAQLLLGQPQKALDELKEGTPANAKQRAQIDTLRGDAHLALGKPELARSFYAKAQQTVPNFAPALGGVARSYLVEKDLRGAQAAIQAALAAAPDSVELWILKGDIARALNENLIARAAYEKAIAIDPDQMVAQFNLISTQLVMGDTGSAQKNVERLRALYPEHPMTFYHQGLLQFRIGQYAQASNSAARALRAVPDHVPSLVLLGASQFVNGSHAQASKSFIRVLELQPDHAYARKLLVATLIKMKDAKRALEFANAGLELAPTDPQLLALAGSAYGASGDSTKAAQLLQTAVERDPTSAELKTDLGLSLLATGNIPDATSTLQQAAKLEKQGSRAATVLIGTLLQQGQYDEALANIAQLQRNGVKDAQIYNLQGIAFLGKKDLVKARQSFSEALRLDPTFIEAASNLAQLDLHAKDRAAARKRFETVLAADKNNIAAMMALARMEGKARNYAAATQWLERARSVKPASIEPRLMLARYYIETHEPKKALVYANEARAIDPHSEEAFEVLGSAQLAAGDLANARSTFAAYSNEFPQSVLAHYRLGTTNLALRRWSDAIAGLTRARALKAGNFDIESALAAAYLQSGKQDQALEIARELRTKNPSLPAAHMLEGNVYLAQRKSADALQAYQKAFDLDPSGMAATLIFQARMQSGQSAAAFAGLQQWVASHPKDWRSRLSLATAYFEQKNYPAAAQTYQDVLKIHPDHVVALNNLAASYMELNDSRALAVAQRAYQLAAEDPAVMDTYGSALLKNGKAAQAVGVLQKAAAKAPESPEIRYHYSMALLQNGDKQRARRELEAVIALGKPFPQLREAQDKLQTF